jgi:DNA-binding GntR family transcriptional regulator
MSLTRKAYERIRNAIVYGDLEFGEQLSETQIAKTLGMSKAPVRAAFIELKDKGLVNIVPQSGTYVFSPTAEDVRALSQLRALLEHEALFEAMKRNPDQLLRRMEECLAQMKRALSKKDYEAYGLADNAYHLAIIEESGNRYLKGAYLLGSAALEALRVRLQKGGNFRDRSYGEHSDMIKFLRAGKIEKAAEMMRTHILIINDSLDILPLREPGERPSPAEGRRARAG